MFTPFAKPHVQSLDLFDLLYKTDSTAQPVYLHSVLKQYVPSRRLRSSDCSLLAVPHVRTCFGSRSFAVAAPTTWNSLPLHIRNSSPILGFRRQLKLNSKLFSIIQPSILSSVHPSTPAPQIRWFSSDIAHSINLLTYLLTLIQLLY